MRVGLLYSLGPDCSYRDALEQIVEADRLGLDFALFEEHHGTLGCPEIAPLATAAAARTRSIRLGPANRQLCLDFPINSAEDYAIVDIVSRGRLIMGVSAGERAEEFAAAGVPWEQREARFFEALGLMRTVWTQSNVQFVGEHYRFPLHAKGPRGWRREPFKAPFVDQWRRGQIDAEYLSLLPRPVQLPHPPIWVNATSRAVIEWAGSRGYSLFVSAGQTDEQVRETLGWYEAALRQAGRDRNEVEVALARELFLAEDGRRAREIALPALRARLEASRQGASRQPGGRAEPAGASSDAQLLESCACYGSYDEVLERLLRLKGEVGINHLLCRTYLPGIAHLEALASIRLIASMLQTRLVA